ncbi:DUF6303 family protein [Streptomyces sp. NPDC015127]|uniref:DUF6303 family protein n=1 Tax=Streptomyces sp. NPDC015127 TaxID=3364939 RepID=UPI0036F7CABB
MTHSARLSNSYEGEWELYVVTDSLNSRDWPDHDFGRSVPVPTLLERVEALASLGYLIADGALWEWQELPSGHAERVRLLAAVDVRPIGGMA